MRPLRRWALHRGVVRYPPLSREVTSVDRESFTSFAVAGAMGSVSPVKVRLPSANMHTFRPFFSVRRICSAASASVVPLTRWMMDP